ncbi:efflux RND transporter periplasmic adaptor subunit, partial [Sphingomonas bacterium]|uniref:efflux RND transporter periplasmic adaptor subunit n=1 Tax=Sphingomonas bacterium TaxID=1895847 RepID=UPI001575F7D6
MAALHDLTHPPRAEASPLGLLLGWEASVRHQASVAELLFFVANETRGLVAHDQMFVLQRPLMGEGWQVRTASSLVAIDRNAPVIRAIEAAVRDRTDACDLDAPEDEALADYPFRHWLWRPLVGRDGTAFGALLLARGHPFDATEAARLARLGDTVQHGWLALSGNKPVRRLPRLTRRQRRAAIAAGAAVALFPVHLSVLAPVEVVAAHPFVVAAPFQGVVASIDVAPGASVARGQTLLRFDDVKLRNELSLAQQRLQVARAKVDAVASATFGDAAQGRGISIAQAEYQLAAAEYGYARDMLARARVVAPFAGIAAYTDRHDWEGRAVETGQPIMEVADPAQVRYRVDLPTREQMPLTPGSGVTVWLDSQPLWSQSATLADAGYQARQTADGTLAFALDAAPSDGAAPRIGSRGTAR